MTPSTPPGDYHVEVGNATTVASLMAEIARLREREAQSVEMNEHYQRKADEAEARVKELEGICDEADAKEAAMLARVKELEKLLEDNRRLALGAALDESERRVKELEEDWKATAAISYGHAMRVRELEAIIRAHWSPSQADALLAHEEEATE